MDGQTHGSNPRACAPRVNSLSVCIQILLSVCICLSLSQRMAKKVANGQLEEEDLLVSDLKALLTCTAPV